MDYAADGSPMTDLATALNEIARHLEESTSLFDYMDYDSPDYKYQQYDPRYYSVQSIAASAAICNIENFVHYFNQPASLQETALYNYLKQFDFSSRPIATLLEIRDSALNNAFVCKEWDSIKCFLRLMTCRGTPLSIEGDGNGPCGCCDGFSDTDVEFKDFTIVQTRSADRFAGTNTAGWSYSINVTYHQLKLILSGDVETNPGPVVISKLTPEQYIDKQRKQIVETERELAKYKRALRKQQNHIQRQLEMEKRKRKKNREAKSNQKRCAQTLVGDIGARIRDDVAGFCSDPWAMAEGAKISACVAANSILPGIGSAAATVVGGVRASSIVSKIGPSIDMLQHLLKTFSDAVDELRALFGISGDYDLVGILISLVSVLQCMKDKALLLLTMHCANLARLLKISLNSLIGLVPNFTPDDVSFGEDGNIRVGQSLVFDMISTAADMPNLLPFTGFLSFFCGVFSLLCSGSIPTPDLMMRHFANVGRAAQGFRALKDMFSWVFSYVSEIYYTTVYGISAEEYRFMQSFPQLEELYAAVKLVETFDKKLLDSSAAIANQVMTIGHELSEYHYQATKLNSRTSVNLVASLQKRIKDQHEWALHSPARCHTIREEPTSVYMYGEPGVGKSVATEVLKARIFKKYLKEKGVAFQSCSHTRKSQNVHWEGYTNQPILIFDDYANVVDTPQVPNPEFRETQQAINTASFPLHMAALPNKGNCNFDSEFLIATSNQKIPEIKSMVSPASIYRRFQIWAEFKIDPLYGLPGGKDKYGNSYYQYDKIVAAANLGIDPEEMSPLCVDHYRINLYKVWANMQTGSVQAFPIPHKQGITFNDFWEYFTRVHEERKRDGAALANAIRKEADLDPKEVPITESFYMEQFDRIFHPEKFIETVAAEEKYEILIGDDYFDAEEDSIFGSVAHLVAMKCRIKVLKKTYFEHKQKCKSHFTKLWQSLKNIVDLAANKLISVATFILSFLANASGRLVEYLPSLPTSSLLVGIFAAAVALFGSWYSGIFSQSKKRNFCKFCKAPSRNESPCEKCPACKILQFPSSGDMWQHFLERTGIRSIQKDLKEIGMEREELEDIREAMRQEMQAPIRRKKHFPCKLAQIQEANEQVNTIDDAYKIFESLCWQNCSACDIAREMEEEAVDDTSLIVVAREIVSGAVAQRVYDNAPRVPNKVSHAQRVYDSQPRVAPKVSHAQRTMSRRVAESFVECKTEMHIGARKYAQRDRVQIEQTTQVLLNNSVWIQAADKNGMCSRSNGVFLVGRTMITTAHTIIDPPHLDPVEYLIIRNPYSTEAAIKVPIDQCQISQAFQMDGSPVDLVLVSFPPVVPNRPRILSKFLNADDIYLLGEGDMTFSGFYEVGGKTIVQEKYPASFQVSTKKTEYYLHQSGMCPKSASDCVCPISIGNHIDYDLETASGMCGALLSISNRLIHTKLIGFHVAGGKGAMALGVLTTRQFLENALKQHVEKFNIPKSYLIDGRLPYSQSWVDPSYRVSMLDVGDCINVGVAPSPAVPTKTQLSPSLVFGKIQPNITKPAHLVPVEIPGEGKVDPMIKGIKKVLGPQKYIDPKMLEIALNDVFQGIGPPPSGKGKVHTYAEAITGIDGDPYKRPINRGTSPGYPYNMNNKSKGKTAWMGSDENYIVDNPELKNDVSKLIENAKQGIRGDAISIATLKDEKRPFSKVDAGKTRVFEACPQHLVVAIRQYFLDFVAHVMRNRIDNGIAVGINPYSLEWTKLAHHLLSKGNNMVAGDFSNLDGSLVMQILVAICEKINEWYTAHGEPCDQDEIENLIRSVLFEHICNADVLLNGEVFRQTHSQPSGNPLTVILNSIFVAVVMRIAYLILKVEQGLPMVCDYRENVAEIEYGDDDVKSIVNEILSWFNQQSITRALASIGLTYTDETKSESARPCKRLSEITFLKRRFCLRNDGTYMAPMELESVLEITNWIKGKAKKLATLENCEQTLMELSLHDKEVYEFWSKRIREELLRVGITIRVPTYIEQMCQYRYNRDKYERTEYVPLW